MTPKEHVFNIMDALRSPVLTYNIGWADAIPKRLLDIIPIARIVNIGSDIATYPEGVAYIYTASLCFPLNHEWTEIYTHLTCKISEQFWKEDHWDIFEAPKILDKYEQDMLNDLLRWIYTKRRFALKQNMKLETQILKKDLSIEEVKQLNLF